MESLLAHLEATPLGELDRGDARDWVRVVERPSSRDGPQTVDCRDTVPATAGNYVLAERVLPVQEHDANKNTPRNISLD